MKMKFMSFQDAQLSIEQMVSLEGGKRRKRRRKKSKSYMCGTPAPVAEEKVEEVEVSTERLAFPEAAENIDFGDNPFLTV